MNRRFLAGLLIITMLWMPHAITAQEPTAEPDAPVAYMLEWAVTPPSADQIAEARACEIEALLCL